MITMIHNEADVAQAVVERGFLPFFKGEVANFSLEEMTPPELWFPDDSLQDMGVWDYKSDVILDADCAYGKFYRNKACFVSMRWYPHLVNYRRSRHTVSADEQLILDVLRENHSLLSRQLKRMSGYTPKRPTRAGNPLERTFLADVGARLPHQRSRADREAFDTAITRLQMGGHVLIAAFEYNHDKHGRRYGWGVARYCTPEDFFGPDRMMVDCTPEESRELIRQHLNQLIPHATTQQIDRIIE